MKKSARILATLLAVLIIFCSFPIVSLADEYPEVDYVQIEDTTILQGSGSATYTEGAAGEKNYWMKYDYRPGKITVALKDGTVLYSDGMEYVEYDYNIYWLDYTDNQTYENQWGVGEHTVNATIMGVSTSFKVIVESNHIDSVTFHDAVVYDGLDTYTATEWDGEKDVEYKAFRVNDIRFDISFDDGTEEKNVTSVNYNGEYYYAWSFLSGQSPNNEWKPGNTYKLPVNLEGFISEINVTVKENPLVKLEFGDVSVYEDSGIYSYYPNATLTFSDGTEITQKSDASVEYKDYWYGFEFEDTQEDTPWEVGNTYKATGTVMGVTADFNVTVVPSPIAKLEISDTFVVDGVDNLYGMYNYQIEGVKVTFTDGSEQTFVGTTLYYNEEFYCLSYSDNQWGEPWQVGSTYTITASLLGVTADFEVEVREFPFESLQVKDIVVSSADKESYGDNRYNYCPEYTFTLKDGSSYTICGQKYPSIEVYGIPRYLMTISGDEQYYEPWVPGNSYKLTARFGTLSADFTVTVAEENECDGFTYLNTDDGAIILKVPADSEILTLPTTLDGKKVIGISGLGDSVYTLKELTIPDGIKFISTELFQPTAYYEGSLPLETLRLGKDVENFDGYLLTLCDKQKNIFVSSENKNYCDVDGVLYDKDKTTLVWYPLGRDKKIVVSATVSDISVTNMGVYYYGGYYVVIDGESEYYKTVDGITYNKDMTEVISCSRTKTGDVTLPDTVESIKIRAFAECQNITGVKIPESVVSIEYSTFENCTSLKNIEFSENVETISAYAFSGCTSLESIDLFDDMSIGEAAFVNDTSLKTINFKEKLENGIYFSYRSFENTGLTELTIPAKTYGFSYTFSGCKKLKKVTIEEGMDEIASGMFSCCTSLDTVNIPSSVYSIYSHAFYKCASLKNIELSENTMNIGSNAFEKSGLVSITLNDSLTYLGDEVFLNCADLKEVNIGIGLTDLPASVFKGCGIENIVIPENVEYIGVCAFSDCKNLKKCEIKNPNTVVLEGAFKNSSLEEITIGEGTKCIYSEAYYGTALKSIDIPNSVTDIMYGAFQNSSNLLNIGLPDNLEHIGKSAFDGTAWYNKLPTGTIYTGKDGYILYGYKGTIPTDSAIKINDNVTVLADSVFENGLHGNTTGLSEVVMIGSVNEIPERAFFGCSGLKSLVIGNNIKSVGGGAFGGCSNLTDIYFLGNEEDWQNIYVNRNYEVWKENYGWEICTNSEFTNATVHFIDSYEVTEGDGTVYDIESEEPISFRSTAELSDFEEVKMDGKTVARENYEVTEGSTIITFLPAFLKTLSPGEHVVSIVSTTGTAFAGLAVQAPFVVGDVTGDGNIDAKDLTRLKKYLADKVNTQIGEGADCTGDGNVDAKDLTRLKKYLADKVNTKLGKLD